jgi:hypothetical protein
MASVDVDPRTVGSTERGPETGGLDRCLNALLAVMSRSRPGLLGGLDATEHLVYCFAIRTAGALYEFKQRVRDASRDRS